MTKPPGTGKPARMRMPRLTAFPPASILSRHSARSWRRIGARFMLLRHLSADEAAQASGFAADEDARVGDHGGGEGEAHFGGLVFFVEECFLEDVAIFDVEDDEIDVFSDGVDAGRGHGGCA